MKKTGSLDLSIIIPAYNAERTIIRCLNSIAYLIMRGAQVIVVNDGSVDQTQSLILSSKFVDLIVLKNLTENLGSAHARNLGLEFADRNWVVFLDADDELMEVKLADILDGLNSNKDWDLVMAGYESVDESGNLIGSEFIGADLFTDEQRISLMLHQRGFTRYVYSRKFLNDNSIQFFPTKVQVGGENFNMDDYFFLLQAILWSGERVLVVNHIIYRYYTSTTNRKNYREQCALFPIGFRLFLNVIGKSQSGHKIQRRMVLDDAIQQYLQCVVELKGKRTLKALPMFIFDIRQSDVNVLVIIKLLLLSLREFLRVNYGFRRYFRKKVRFHALKY